MKVVLQKVSSASVTVDYKLVSQIEKGIVMLVGFKETDSAKEIKYILEKVINLRIFEDENEKLNLSLKDVLGGFLIVPNFTLYADTKKGRRPNYFQSASAEKALSLFEEMKSLTPMYHEQVKFGIFQTHMSVNIVNDGPVTIVMETD